MKITRKKFLHTAAGAAALFAIPSFATMTSACAPLASKGKPKRGVSTYSYAGLYNVSMTLEDCLADMNTFDAEGLEILANSHIDGYPNPSDAWVENFKAMCAKYKIVPVEYGHWVDSRLYQGRELTTKESYDMLVADIKLASRLGFTVGRTKLGVIDGTLTPVTNWREFIEMALPVAEENNFRMCPEIHMPTLLKSKMVDDYVEFIEKTKTKYFGLNIDFGVFAKREAGFQREGVSNEISAPEDIVPLLPYTYACHAKFTNMTDDMVDTTTPYDKIINLMIENKWDGYLLSEYEGVSKDVPGYVPDQLRKQHIMMKRLLGEV